MYRSSQRRSAAGRLLALAGLLAVAGCSTPRPGGTLRPAHAHPTPQPTAPTSAPAAAAATPNPDLRFVQGMMAHHAQALAMTALVPSRAARPQIRLLAERIEVSQRDEIAQMQQWLRRRGVADGAHHDAGHAQHGAGDHAGMPGMLTAAEMARLAAASGGAFDRLFLESMIRHHEGALVMVAELFASPGAAQQTELFQLASDVDSDQRMEIARMRSLLDTL